MEVVVMEVVWMGVGVVVGELQTTGCGGKALVCLVVLAQRARSSSWGPRV